jgi:uncharacterized protein YndB with AHSA1/START domain
MAESRFVYVTLIRASAEKIWDHLTDPQKNKVFWSGYSQQTSWRVGDDYAIVDSAGKAWDTGKVLAFEPPRRLSVTWLHLNDAAMTAEGESTATFELEPASDTVTRLTVTHSIGVAESKLIGAVSTGWPMILSSLKSLLETGEALG